MVAALLHDTLDDTDVEFFEIEEQFGSEVGAGRVGVCWPAGRTSGTRRHAVQCWDWLVEGFCCSGRALLACVQLCGGAGFMQ